MQVSADSERIAAEQKNMKEVEREAKAELERSQPQLDAAEEAVGRLQKAEIAELRGMNSPVQVRFTCRLPFFLLWFVGLLVVVVVVVVVLLRSVQ